MTPLKKEAIAQETTLHRQRVQAEIRKAIQGHWRHEKLISAESLIRAIDAGEIPNLRIVY